MTRQDRSNEATNVEVVAWALASLHGAEDDVHLEDIAVKAFELKPGAFRWDQPAYETFIDKDKVRVSLTDAAKPNYGGLTEAVGKKIAQLSKPTDWWRLTPNGIRWLADNDGRLSVIFGQRPPAIKAGAARQVREKVRASELYREYSSNGNILSNIYMLADLVECSPDAPDSVMRNRFERLEAQVLQIGEPTLARFTNAVRGAYASVLQEDGGGRG